MNGQKKKEPTRLRAEMKNYDTKQNGKKKAVNKIK